MEIASDLNFKFMLFDRASRRSNLDLVDRRVAGLQVAVQLSDLSSQSCPDL